MKPCNRLLEEDNGGSYILKDDAYTAYAEMCEQHGERTTTPDKFKDVVSKMASLNVETAQPRSVTPGDSREQAWKYVRFSEQAKDLLGERLTQRYFDDESESEGSTEGAETTDSVTDAHNARPVQDVALDPTGYANVTVEVLKVENPEGENTPAMRATVKDESSAIDVISWDNPDALAQGNTVLIENAEVSEFDGDRQLVIDDTIASVTPVQRGVGHTERQDTANSQSSLQTATDGGDETDGQGKTHAAQKVVKLLNDVKKPMDKGNIVPTVADQYNIPPETVQRGFEKAKKRGDIQAAPDDPEKFEAT